MRNCLFESSVNELCAAYKASLKAKSYGSTPTPKEFNSKVKSVYAGVPFLMKKEGKTMDLSKYPNVTLIQHPLLSHKITILYSH